MCVDVFVSECVCKGVRKEKEGKPKWRQDETRRERGGERVRQEVERWNRAEMPRLHRCQAVWLMADGVLQHTAYSQEERSPQADEKGSWRHEDVHKLKAVKEERVQATGKMVCAEDEGRSGNGVTIWTSKSARPTTR
jgi:hypothetical protein